MVLLLSGASHTGKTALAQKILERYHYSYLSIDHLKMGLIRSGNTHLTPESDDRELTAYLWPIVREMVKTAVENKQNLVVEGCYIPFDFARDFAPEYLDEIRACWLIFSDTYLKTHFSDVVAFADVIEDRLDVSDLSLANLLAENAVNLYSAKKHGVPYLLVDDYSDVTPEAIFSL